jgi:hypothetical protein
MKTFSRPAASSNVISLKPPPEPGVLSLFQVLLVLFSGSLYGKGAVPL